jgi:large repetitive protein
MNILYFCIRPLFSKAAGSKALVVFGMLSMLSSFMFETKAQTGDLAIIGVNIDASPHEIAVVTLAEIASGTTTYLSDYRWNGTEFVSDPLVAGNTVEGVMTWTTTSAIAAGTIVTFTLNNAPTVVTTTHGNVSATGWTQTNTALRPMSSGGDNWFIYQGSAPTTPTTFIFGWTNAATATNSTAGEWLDNIYTPNNITSNLPATLTNGTNAIALTTPTYHFDNMVYTGTLSGTKAQLLSSICNLSNWTGNETVTQNISAGTGSFGANPAFTVIGGCSMSASITSQTNVSCNGGSSGSLTVTQSSGTANFDYAWSNGATTSNSTSSTNTITGLSAGTYTVTVTDDNACTSTASATITQPTNLVASAAVSSTLDCGGDTDGQVTASATGGTTSYTYAWNTGGTSALETSLGAGTYSVTITDQNGCTDSASVTMTQPTNLVASATVSSTLDCGGDTDGQVTASATGGTTSYTYAWNTGGTSALETSLGAGTYSVTITDANGCTDSASVALTEPTALIASISVDSVESCSGANDGGATASATGGIGTYSYSWSNSATTATIVNLGAGNYSVTITDQNGCTSSTDEDIFPPQSFGVFSYVDSNITCNGANDGGATATVSGGQSTFSYVWSNSATTTSITGVSAGTYTVTVTDTDGCSDTSSVTISEPSLLVASAILDSNISCNNGSDGGATASATGGTMPYTYTWSNSATTASITGVVVGTYSVTITDANGCIDSASIEITEPTSLIASSSVSFAIDCFGDPGNAAASATGGTTPYSYSWSIGSVNAAISEIPAGTYSVTISDANGCTDSASVTLTEPTAVVASTALDSNESCGGYSDGGATAAATGGTASYTYNWSNGATTASITGVTAGTYSVTITDANGCTDSASIAISQPPTLVASTTINSNITCNGASDGGATAFANGGTGIYTYTWSNAATTASITGVIAGTYTVTITDANGCTDSETAIVTEPTALVASNTLDSTVSCNGGFNGGATAFATGGTQSYTYSWSNASTNSWITSVAAGTYSVTITDNNGCTDSASVIVTQPSPLVAAAIADSNVSCNGGADGGATASVVSGGTSPYSYAWSNASINSWITGVSAGTYSVTITDQNGCTDSSSTTIAEPTAVVASTALDSNESCGGYSDGGATAAATGGTASYTYNWSNGATTASITGVTAGTYSVTITDANGCTDSASIAISQPPTLVASTTINSNITCNGASDGGATAFANGGTGIYTYTWSNAATTASITGVIAGTYTVTITDANGCADSETAIVTEPTALVASNTLDSTVSCNGGFDGGATAFATGGTMPYTYTWSASASSATTASVTGLNAGTFSVTITDANGCTDSASIAITEPSSLSSSASVSSNFNGANISCNGASGGEAIASATGGTTPHSYMWSNSATTATITGVLAGTYSVTITDQNGCTDSSSVTLTEPIALFAFTTLDSIASVSSGYSGGTGSVTYAWSNGSISSSQTSLAAATYTVTITDANGCTSSDQIQITKPTGFTYSPGSGCLPLTVSFTDTSTNVVSRIWDFGNGQTSTLANPSIVYSTLGSYDVTLVNTYTYGVTDTLTKAESINPTGPQAAFSANPTGGCSVPHTVFFTDQSTSPDTWSWNFGDGSTSTAQNPIHSFTGSGIFSVSLTVTDTINGCSNKTYDTIVVSIPLLTVSTDSNVLCNGQSNGGASVATSNTQGTVTYAWSNGSTANFITGVAAGTYTVTISDASGCTNSGSTTITEPTALLAATVTDGNVSCNSLSDGLATASATGGTTPYTYAWSASAGSANTASVAGLTAGTYTATITDANGCTSSASSTITEPALLVASSIIDSNVSCNGGFDGGTTAWATGGTAPYTYSWSNGATTASITGIVAGTYSVTITDQNGCTDSSSSTITEPAVLAVSNAIDSTVSCNGGSDGGLTANVSGGSTPYTYAWSNGATTASITGVSAGIYTATITDAHGCTATDFDTITQPTSLLSSSAVDSTVSCNGASDGGITVTPSGGTAAYTYTWSNGDNTASISGLIAGTYTATITDANGCITTSSETVTEPTVLIATSVVDSNISCNGDNDGGATASASGGTGAYTYAWSNSATTATITGVVAGTYTATITDANGCTSTTSATITEPAVLVASSIVDNNISCNAASDGGATASATGGTMPYTYAWSASAGSATTATVTGLVAGTYTATITDANGCTSSTSSTITEPLLLEGTIQVDSNVSCSGFSDGGASVSSSGGTSPYTYAWSNGATTSFITGIAAGTYAVTITDANGCVDAENITLTQPSALSMTLTVVEEEECIGGNDGIVSNNIAGGTTPYSFAWSNGSTDSTNTTATAGAHTLTVTDANGCVITASANVISVDTTLPAIQTQNLTIYLDAAGSASITTAQVDNGTTDDCGLDTVWLSQYIFGCADSNNNLIWFYALDGFANIDSVQVTITVLDTISPLINCPSPIAANNDLGVCGALVNYSLPTATDNCTGTVNVIQIAGLASGTTFPIGITTNRFVAIDSSGNTDTCQFDVTITDNELPEITCIADVFVNNDIDSCGAIVTFNEPVTTDNCGIDTTYQTAGLESGSLFPIGVSTVTFETVDDNGNISNCSFDVTVTDNQAPVIVCQNDIAMCDTTYVFALPLATDNCTIDTIFQINGIKSGQFYPVGVTTNEFVAIDIYGNADTCSFNVTRDAEVAGVFAGDDEIICNQTDYQLSADIPTIGAGVWASFSGANVADINDAASSISNLSFGDNIFFWTVSNGTCPEVIDTVSIAVDRLPTAANAGEDMQLCDVYELDLDANAPSVGSGVWTQLNDGVIDDTLENTTTISSLPFGVHSFVWTTSNGVCPSSSDTVDIYVDPNPVLTASTDEIVFSEVEVQLGAISDIEVEYTWNPSLYLDNHTIANPIAVPSESITYVVEGVSAAGCYGSDTLNITMFLSEDVYTGFSPNGDNINDTWNVPGIENYPEAFITVVNRAGAQVYSGKATDPPFDGRFNGTLLPIGSYYYVIELNDGQSDALHGILTIIY